MSTIIGIDPGVSGAIVILINRNILMAFDMPTIEMQTGSGRKRRWVDEHGLVNVLRDYDTARHAFVEWTWPRPTDGKIQAFAFGDSLGVVKGVLAALGIPSTHISPQRWKKDLAVGKGKDASRARASELMPKGAEYWLTKGSHGRAEAALIAYWGAQSLQALTASPA